MTQRASPIPHAFITECGAAGFGVTGGLLLFVVVSGCAVALLPFSTFSQAAVLLHTIIGFVAVGFFVVWQLSHWLGGRTSPRNVRKVSGYIGFWFLAASCVTGAIVALQAVFGRYINATCDSLHLWTSLVALPFLAYHVYPSARPVPTTGDAPPPDYTRERRRSWAIAAVMTLALFAFTAAFAARFSAAARAEQAGDHWHDAGPAPFQPSNVDTETRRPIAVATLASSDSCGTADCHAAIYREWRASAHRWSAEDEFFQEVRSVTTQVKGPQETEKCGACHDPVSMLSGHKDPKLGRTAPGYKEGDSCVVCHAVRSFDERGIGSYVLGVPREYVYDHATGRFARLVNHFLIRAYPDQHNRDYNLALARKPESCAPCHKEYDLLDEREGPVQVETQFDDWKQGKWNTDRDASRRLYCQQCHMYLVETQRAEADPYDLKKQFGMRHRTHAFAAGNQYMPAALAVDGATAHLERVNKWLRGEHAVPEIEKVWPRGPLMELTINTPSTVKRGERVSVKLALANKKVGHGFPTGPLNIARAWLELVVRDASGTTVFASGLLDAQNRITAGSYVLKPLAINLAGHMVLRPDLWQPVGPQFRRAVLAGESDTYGYEFQVPPGARGPLSVDARLRFRRGNQFFMDAVYGGAARTAPITDMSTAHGVIALRR